MAKVTRANVAPLNDRLTITLSKEDYFQKYETDIKNYAVKANMPGFRKGKVSASLIKRMYGKGIITETIVKALETSVTDYLTKEKIEILNQPVPEDLENISQTFDPFEAKDYTFSFEIGLKPEIKTDLKAISPLKYKIEVGEKALEEEMESQIKRFGTSKELETLGEEDALITTHFAACDKDGNETPEGKQGDHAIPLKNFKADFRKKLKGKAKGYETVSKLSSALLEKELEHILEHFKIEKADADNYFKITVNKLEVIEPAVKDEKLFKQIFPAKDLKTEEEFKNELKAEIEKVYEKESKSFLDDQIYHELLEKTTIELPEDFLKRSVKFSDEKIKTDEDLEKAFPSYVQNLKWALISDKLVKDHDIKIEAEDLKAAVRKQIEGYFGGQIMGDDEEKHNKFIEDTVDRMMQDQKYLNDTYQQLATEKLFEVLEAGVAAKEEKIVAEEFVKKVQSYHDKEEQHDHNHAH